MVRSTLSLHLSSTAGTYDLAFENILARRWRMSDIKRASFELMLDSVKGFNVHQRFMGTLYSSFFLALYEHPSISSVSQNVLHRAAVPIASSIRKISGESIGAGVLDRSG